MLHIPDLCCTFYDLKNKVIWTDDVRVLFFCVSVFGSYEALVVMYLKVLKADQRKKQQQKHFSMLLNGLIFKHDTTLVLYRTQQKSIK